MKNEKQSYKPTQVIDGYDMKKQLHGGYKIIKYWHMSNEQFIRKQTLHKNLPMNVAEEILYKLENKQK